MRFRKSPSVSISVTACALAVLVLGVCACKPATEGAPGSGPAPAGEVAPAAGERAAAVPGIAFDPEAYQAERA